MTQKVEGFTPGEAKAICTALLNGNVDQLHPGTVKGLAETLCTLYDEITRLRAERDEAQRLQQIATEEGLKLANVGFKLARERDAAVEALEKAAMGFCAACLRVGT